MAELKLAALLCSRLCHDLVGPIGALNNGIEILSDEEDSGMREQATQLLGDSADEAARRLRFYRYAFGAAGGMAQAIPLSEARAAAIGLYNKGRVSLDWPLDPAAPPLDKSLVKLLLNVILVAGTALPRGGTVSVQPASGGVRFAVGATGTVARIGAEMLAALRAELDEAVLDSQNVVAHLAALLAREQGLQISVRSPTEGSVELAIAEA